MAPGQKPIIRYCHDVSEEGSTGNNFQYELYPPIFTLRKLQYDKGVSEKVMEERMAEAHDWSPAAVRSTKTFSRRSKRS